ncbi:aromatic ring-hydroxylating oxygenase subunit alpha [Hwanghaeella sp.]|uniref:aromatic ring-hydroxylating oxygenase subunit alpha n=1 Tax=Hwanghaeella sp. TaxID=2605943 RepID=UPI003CCBC9A8
MATSEQATIGQEDVQRIHRGYTDNPLDTMSLHADAYTRPEWLKHELKTVFARSWQWVCHEERLRQPGSYVTAEIAGRPIFVLRDHDGAVRAFYNVCKHRAHHLLTGSGSLRRTLVCPYHGWAYDLTGQLRAARETGPLENFQLDDVCLDSIAVETFCGFIYVNLDTGAASLSEQSDGLEDEIRRFAPDVNRLTFAHRLTYDIKSNWKNVIDNFLECYHCHIAHKDFVTLVDMDTYKVTTHGIYSSHMAEAGRSVNSAYSVEGATVRDHAVWWLWPNTCLMRYPGRGNFLVLNVIPVDVNRTIETYDFYLEEPTPNEAEMDAIRYIDEVLQPEDIALCESVQRGMDTPVFEQGRIVSDPNGSGLSEHALHHFHGLLLGAYSGERA